MQTTYRLNTQELSIAFVKSLKMLLPNQEIEITVKTLADADSITDTAWANAVAQNPAFSFLHEKEEDVYSITDGTPLTDEI